MATQRLAGLLEPTHEVRRLNTSPEALEHVQADVRFNLDKVRHHHVFP